MKTVEYCISTSYQHRSFSANFRSAASSFVNKPRRRKMIVNINYHQMNIDYKKYLNRCGKQHFVVYLHGIIKLKYIKVKNGTP